MRRFLFLVFFLMNIAVVWAMQTPVNCKDIPSFTELSFDSLYIYNETGEMIGKKITGFDKVGNEVMYADFDYINGSWIANVMKLSEIKEDKQVTVDFFWEVNSWIPAEMLVVEFDASKQKQSCYYQWEEDEWILEKVLK